MRRRAARPAWYGARVDARLHERRRDLHGAGACRGVHDPRPWRRPYRLDQRRAFRHRVGMRLNDQLDVRPVEPAGDDRRVPQAEPVDDLGPQQRRGRRRQGEDGRPPHRRGHRAEAAVLGPEVGPPLRDAVRLVDDEQGWPGVGQPVQHRWIGERFGRDEQELDRTASERVQGCGPFARGPRGVDRRRGETQGLEGGELVLLQRDQRRDDEGRAVDGDAGQLVDGALATAGRQQRQGVTSGRDRLHGLRLSGQQHPVAQRLPGGGADGGTIEGDHGCRIGAAHRTNARRRAARSSQAHHGARGVMALQPVAAVCPVGPRADRWDAVGAAAVLRCLPAHTWPDRGSAPGSPEPKEGPHRDESAHGHPRAGARGPACRSDRAGDGHGGDGGGRVHEVEPLRGRPDPQRAPGCRASPWRP